MKSSVPKHLQDCGNCNDEHGYPHQRMHHDDKTGECMLGKLLGQQCQCLGFVEKRR